MGVSTMVAVALTLLCFSGFVSCKSITQQPSRGASSDESQSWKCSDEGLCKPGFFDLNTISSLNFSENGHVRIGGKQEKQLQCDACDESGMPTTVSCMHPDTSTMIEDSWLCDGDFPTKDYFIDSAIVHCDTQEEESCPQLDCKKEDSCILKFTIRKRLRPETYFPDTPGLPWWMITFMVIFGVIFFVVLSFICYAFYLQLRVMKAVSEQGVQFNGYQVTTATVCTSPPASSAPPSSPPAYEENFQSGIGGKQDMI